MILDSLTVEPPNVNGPDPCEIGKDTVMPVTATFVKSVVDTAGGHHQKSVEDSVCALFGRAH